MLNHGYIIASKQVAVEHKKVGWMYKEFPTDPNDSGWRVFSGDESIDYQEDPGNFGIYDTSSIISIDPEIEHFLFADVGTEIERDRLGNLSVIK